MEQKRIGIDAYYLTIATWEMLTLKQQREKPGEILKSKIDLIAVQEVHWQGSGRIDKT